MGSLWSFGIGTGVVDGRTGEGVRYESGPALVPPEREFAPRPGPSDLESDSDRSRSPNPWHVAPRSNECENRATGARNSTAPPKRYHQSEDGTGGGLRRSQSIRRARNRNSNDAGVEYISF